MSKALAVLLAAFVASSADASCSCTTPMTVGSMLYANDFVARTWVNREMTDISGGDTTYYQASIGKDYKGDSGKGKIIIKKDECTAALVRSLL